MCLIKKTSKSHTAIAKTLNINHKLTANHREAIFAAKLQSREGASILERCGEQHRRRSAQHHSHAFRLTHILAGEPESCARVCNIFFGSFPLPRTTNPTEDLYHQFPLPWNTKSAICDIMAVFVHCRTRRCTHHQSSDARHCIHQRPKPGHATPPGRRPANSCDGANCMNHA